ncbi:GNAT family N-acetyltransferase [Streptomyces clavuligerus]|uniref:Putative acetyltransferase n=1 Tax=Streptomyces clavuligerus TaxID=1901 RepID=B5GWC9_STRCL|nr:GNAT family N-acetyltransferase [Streptomyces clavuligerus]ANW18705.1 acetyltransferase [Streptomyces clavuligerus]AXU13273.1 GNAT family N-acetyltransferase [Streptomyces clavuligerus]EDY50625.1 acetyltransferase [Streptomyces clavuligerus]EFG08622.1 Putative acetyltransferase [Streptomyces clavuligerus]MBY6303223.1 GNAT family N-acetyltransferase [Streptomyces clavuligerus]
MALRFTLDPELDPALHDGVLALWVDATNAGGAVGFVPPVAAEQVRPVLGRQLDLVAQGGMRLLVGHDERGELVATAFLAYNSHRLMTHWVWLYTVMIHPRLQGTGQGRALMDAVAGAARGFEGITAIRLGCRSGMGLEQFYEGCGYQEVGRVPGAIRVAEGDYRDDVTMLLPLR